MTSPVSRNGDAEYERDATLRELIDEIDRPLWRAAALARLEELEQAPRSERGASWEKVMMHDPRATQPAQPGRTILGCIDNQEQWWILKVPPLPT